jgi:protein ImuA
MLPLRPDHTNPSSQPETVKDGKRLAELRRTIAGMQAPAVALDTPGETPLGVAEIDRALGGGLARGMLHEIAACGEAHIAAATGFALGVATFAACTGRTPSPLEGEGWGGGYAIGAFRKLPPSRPSRILSAMVDLPLKGGGEERKTIVWVAEDMALIESGAPYGPGLDLFGLAPERVLTVAGAKAGDVLWAMEQALHCRAVGVVIGELRSASRELDLVVTRRLSLAAAEHGALALLLRTVPGAEASTAATRWVVGAGPSYPSPERGGSTRAERSVGVGSFIGARPPPDHFAVDLPLAGGGKAPHGIGPPRFDLALTRNRRGPLGSWMLEWSVSDASFVLATHPEPVARTPVDRPHRAHAA